MDDGLEPLWKDRPVFFYDQSGCGKSDRAADKNFYSVENYVAELAEIRAVIPKASHLHQIERPEIFAAVVKDFLQDVD